MKCLLNSCEMFRLDFEDEKYSPKKMPRFLKCIIKIVLYILMKKEHKEEEMHFTVTFYLDRFGSFIKQMESPTDMDKTQSNKQHQQQSTNSHRNRSRVGENATIHPTIQAMGVACVRARVCRHMRIAPINTHEHSETVHIK